MEREDKNRDLKKRISEVCNGLVYISETDSNVEPYFGKKLRSTTADEILGSIGITSKDQIVEISTDKFFDRLTTKHEWHREADKERTRRFAKLKTVLEENLTSIRVLKIGRIQIDIYVVGIDEEKRLIGIRTRSVET